MVSQRKRRLLLGLGLAVAREGTSTVSTAIGGSAAALTESFTSSLSAPLLIGPTSKDQCKNNGWKDFPPFKNQGACVSGAVVSRRASRLGITALAVLLLTMVVMGAGSASAATRSTLVKHVSPGAGSSNLVDLTGVGGTLLFEANDGVHGFELWKSTGTSGGTALVKDIKPGAASSGPPSSMVNVNGTVFFAADDGTNGTELWKS